MSNSVEILCLANSRKQGGRCLAGWDGKKLLRPVSDRFDGAFEPHHLGADGRWPQPGERWSFTALGSRCTTTQSENVLVESGSWCFVGDASTEIDACLTSLVDDGPVLGCSERWVPEDDPRPVSFAVIPLHDAEWWVRAPFEESRTLRLAFDWSGFGYHLPVTDVRYPIDWQRVYGTARWALVSLTEPLERRCYKVVAAVFE